MKEKILEFQKNLNLLIDRANNNEITFESIYDHIRIRDLLPETEVIATIWSIDDIREKFPEGTPDHILVSALGDLYGMLQDAAVIAGHEVIADNLNPVDFLEDGDPRSMMHKIARG